MKPKLLRISGKGNLRRGLSLGKRTIDRRGRYRKDRMKLYSETTPIGCVEIGHNGPNVLKLQGVEVLLPKKGWDVVVIDKVKEFGL